MFPRCKEWGCRNLWILVAFECLIRRQKISQQKELKTLGVLNCPNTYLLCRVEWETIEEVLVALEPRPVNSGATVEEVEDLALPQTLDDKSWMFCGELGEDEFWE